MNRRHPLLTLLPSLSAQLLGLALFLLTSAPRAFADVLGHWNTGSITSTNLTGVAYGNGVFVVVGNNEIWTSPDGFKWTKSPAFTADISFSAVTFAQGVFVAVGTVTTSGYNPTLIVTSVDGKIWQQTESIALSGPWTHVTYLNNEFVAYGGNTNGTLQAYAVSADGYNWTSTGFPALSRLTDIAGLAYLNNEFFAVMPEPGLAGTPAQIWAAPTLPQMGQTAINPTEGVILGPAASFPDSTLFGIASGNVGTGLESAVAVGGSGLIAASFYQTTKIITAIVSKGPVVSADSGLTTWTSEVSGTTNTLEAIIFADGFYVAVGADGTVVSSTDANAWTVRDSGTINFLTAVTYGNGHFIAVGTSGTVATSSDESPPSITQQPANSTVTLGKAASFTVAATGQPAPTYQWYFNTKKISGATSSTYTIAKVSTTNAGKYAVVVTNSLGNTTSNTVTLTLATAPAITTQPQALTLAYGASGNLTVAATGTAALVYLWHQNSAKITASNVSGINGAKLTITAATTANAGSYTVNVSNNYGGPITSNLAKVTVKAPKP